MTKTNRSNSGRSRIDSDVAIALSGISGENAINPLSASSFVLTNDGPPEPMTRLIALRITMRRAQLSTHSLETELLAMHSRKARIKHRFAASEFAVSIKASVCKLARSRSNALPNSSLLAYSHLSLKLLPVQRALITSISFALFSDLQAIKSVRARIPCPNEGCLSFCCVGSLCTGRCYRRICAQNITCFC